jgi:8-oxo-dGTP pyrophosphatase MutT (NUDIX family)
MKNFPIKDENGKEYWISRSVAVSGFVFIVSDHKVVSVLAEQRGKGAADFQGLWCCPCGYVDFDETLLQAIERETYEETGVLVQSWELAGINDDPSENHQNITARYIALLDKSREQRLSVLMNGGEVDEIEDLRWIDVDDLDNYDWAFNHRNIIANLVEMLNSNQGLVDELISIVDNKCSTILQNENSND